MRSPIILTGKGFDWDKGNEMAERAVDKDGDVNWRAAFAADPGCMKCPDCELYLWDEGENVRCPDCGHEWTTATSIRVRESMDRYS